MNPILSVSASIPALPVFGGKAQNKTPAGKAPQWFLSSQKTSVFKAEGGLFDWLEEKVAHNLFYENYFKGDAFANGKIIEGTSSKAAAPVEEEVAAPATATAVAPKPIVKEPKCPACSGSGKVTSSEFVGARLVAKTAVCTVCGGTGNS